MVNTFIDHKLKEIIKTMCKTQVEPQATDVFYCQESVPVTSDIIFIVFFLTKAMSQSALGDLGTYCKKIVFSSNPCSDFLRPVAQKSPSVSKKFLQHIVLHSTAC